MWNLQKNIFFHNCCSCWHDFFYYLKLVTFARKLRKVNSFSYTILYFNYVSTVSSIFYWETWKNYWCTIIVSCKKSQDMFHLKCYTLRKLFPYLDAGFQREPKSLSCVKSNPDKHSLFLLEIPTINHIQGLFCLNFSLNSKPWVSFEYSAKNHSSKNLYIFRN